GIRPVAPETKEGLALINGTDGMLGMLVLAARDLLGLLRTADVAAAMSVEALHGAARDTLDHAVRVAELELASAIDNPVVMTDERVESNGNFHGAPVGYVLDFLAIAVADVASISERRTDRFLDVSRNNGLPPFLAADPGVDSGLMIAQYTSAGVV